MVLEDFKFLGVPCHSIGLDDLKVFMADDSSAKRIHFATSHANALRKGSSGNPFQKYYRAFDEKRTWKF